MHFIYVDHFKSENRTATVDSTADTLVKQYQNISTMDPTKLTRLYQDALGR